MIFYTADLHFGHRSVIEFDNRPFADEDEMDDALIRLWNQTVSSKDDVYILGDFACRNKKGEEWYLRQLKGRKYLVIGNHDQKLLNNAAAMSCFEKADKMMHVSDQGAHICLCHYPLAEWYGYYKGHSHVYGHIHDARTPTWEFMRTRRHAYNAGCMLYGYMPVSLRQMQELHDKTLGAEKGGGTDESGGIFLSDRNMSGDGGTVLSRV